MSRPMYEQAADLTKEQDVVGLLEEAWQCRMSKLPIQYKLDYAIRNLDEPHIAAFAEIKVRNYTLAQIQAWGGYMISLAKWQAGLHLVQTTNLPFYLVVKTTDGLYYFGVNNLVHDADTLHKLLDKKIVFAGRQDRGDWQDMEPCVLIDCNLFIKV